MKKLLLCVGVLSALAVTSAVAADMPVKAPVFKAPPPAPSWTGWYAGLNAGYGFGSESNTFNFVPPVAFNFDNVTYSDKLNGFIGGGQIGYNYQITPNSWVAGVEADLQYTDFKGSDNNAGVIAVAIFLRDHLIVVTNPWTYNQDQKVKWLATFRGRLGWTPGDHTWLFYATGGLAVGRVEASDSLTFANGVSWAGSASSTKTGWTVGGGIEARLRNHWTAKLEYLYYDLGHLTVIGTANVVSPLTTTTEFGFHGNIIRAGLNYEFNGN
jgi:outer membrane immunogenic protein